MRHRPLVVISCVAFVAALSLSASAASTDGTTSRAPDTPDVHGRTLPVELAGGESTARTTRLSTQPFKMLAVTWQGDAPRSVEVRTRSLGSWSPWRELHPMTAQATELRWVGRADGVQIEVTGDGARRPRVVLVDPAVAPRHPGSGPSMATAGGSVDPTTAPAPRIRSREAWGANESWRTSDPRYNEKIKQAHVHHTAGTNDYSRADVPAIIRGDYWYHTKVLGWSDLGYNFVVDRFGRIWEGRAGGVDEPVRGAHTLGFNHASFGVAAIGSFGDTRVRETMVDAFVRLTAWKLDRFDREPAGRTRVTSTGSDRYPQGTRVTLPVIDGHRDTNETSCPGARLYAKLPTIRDRAQERADATFAPSPAP